MHMEGGKEEEEMYELKLIDFEFSACGSGVYYPCGIHLNLYAGFKPEDDVKKPITKDIDVRMLKRVRYTKSGSEHEGDCQELYNRLKASEGSEESKGVD